MSVIISTYSNKQKRAHHWWKNFLFSLGPEFNTVSADKVAKELVNWNAVLIPPELDVRGRWYKVKFNSKADQTMFMLRWA